MKKLSKNYLSKQSKIGRGTEFEEPVRLYGEVLIRNNVKIGRFSYVNTRSTLHSGTQVGRYCSIGKNVEVGPFDHPMARLSTSPVSYNAHLHFPDHQANFSKIKLSRKGGVIIGNDVWIASNVIIMRGVKVGDGAVIAAGTIVTRDVDPYSIVIGTPGKELRKRFDSQLIRRLLAVKWWDQPQEIIANLPFDDIDKCLSILENLETSTEEIQYKNETTGHSSKEVTPSVLQKDVVFTAAGRSGFTPRERSAFINLLENKLEEAHAPKAVLELIRENSSMVFCGYDIGDPYDQVIINNKVLHVVDLSRGLDTTDDIPKSLEKNIMLIFSSKK